jgi:hypothetical protein
MTSRFQGLPHTDEASTPSALALVAAAAGDEYDVGALTTDPDTALPTQAAQKPMTMASDDARILRNAEYCD